MPPLGIRRLEGTRLVRVTNSPMTDSYRPADAISLVSDTICYSPSHWSFLSHLFSAYLTIRVGTKITLLHLLFNTFSLFCTDSNCCRRIHHPSLSGSKRYHASTPNLLYKVFCGSQRFSFFPFLLPVSILIMPCHKYEDYEICIVSTWSGLGGYFLEVSKWSLCSKQKNTHARAHSNPDMHTRHTHKRVAVQN